MNLQTNNAFLLLLAMTERTPRCSRSFTTPFAGVEQAPKSTVMLGCCVIDVTATNAHKARTQEDMYQWDSEKRLNEVRKSQGTGSWTVKSKTG